jgi:hypothetical protein
MPGCFNHLLIQNPSNRWSIVHLLLHRKVTIGSSRNSCKWIEEAASPDQVSLSDGGDAKKRGIPYRGAEPLAEVLLPW